MAKAVAQSFQELVSAIQDRDFITVISHTSPDTDAYGSSCGLALALGSLDSKSVWLCNVDAGVESHNFLPGREFVKASLPSDDDWYGERSLLIVLDCGDRKRVGDAWVSALGRFSLIANVDHHNGNENFGQINLVLPDSSSTCEIVYELLILLGITVSKSTATNLMAGIIGDTGGFKYSKVTDRTFEIAAELVRAGANSERLSTELFGSKPLAAVRLESLALGNMELFCDNQAALLTVTGEMLLQTGASAAMTDGLAEKARDINGVNVSALIRLDDGVWKISLRSVSSNFDVSELAKSFGGGGHKQAAAFRWWGEYEELHEKLTAAIETLIDNSLVAPQLR